MFWLFLLLTALATILIKLGAASVMVKTLTIGLMIALIIIGILACMLLWKNFAKPKGQPNDQRAVTSSKNL